MKFREVINEKRNSSNAKILREKLVAEFLNFNTQRNRQPTFEETQTLLDIYDITLTKHYYQNATAQSTIILKELKNSLVWKMEGEDESIMIESIIKQTGVNKNNFHPADIWGFTPEGLSNLISFEYNYRDTPSILMRRLTSAFFDENLKSQDIIGISLKENINPTLKKFDYENLMLPPDDGFTLKPKVSFKSSPKIFGSKKVNKVTAMVSFKVSETKYKFWPVININHTAKDLSIILKGGGGVGSQATGTFDLLANMEHINLTKVPLYGNNSKAPSVMKVPEPSERVWNEVINRLRKSSGLLIDDSIVNLGYDEFIEEGVFNVPAWKRAIVMISFVTMALENWESFSKASYITSMRVGSHYASYWRVS